MSNASVVFLPWVRQGLAARIATPDPLKTPLPAEAPVSVALAVNAVDVPPTTVNVYGPADVIGIDPRQIVRTEPTRGTQDFESNDLAAIEFDNPDLPWLFTPAAADAQGRLRPWCVLVVVKKQEGVRVRPARTELLPVLEIGTPAVPSAELPDLADSWAWAHAQVATKEGATEAELRTAIATRYELSISRLISPRLLAPFTDYIACVVPAFDPGRRVGLGEAVPANAPLAPAWAVGPNAPDNVKLPVYYHWEFRTGAREDFESMIARLEPRDLSEAVGRRAMDISEPGFKLAAPIKASVLLEGALQPIKAPRDAWPGESTKPWFDTLQSIVNAANARSTPSDAEPIVGPPIYGRWHVGRHEVGKAETRSWLDQLNLDPRERVVAAIGTRVIQQQQEELMAMAWEQAGEMAQANQRLRQMQLSLAITTRLHSRHVARIDDDSTLWRFASPAQSRLMLPAAAPGAKAMTMHAMIASSSTPQVTTSAAMRRLSRPRGAIARRANTAMRIAGVQPPATAAKTNIWGMFALYGAQPRIMILTLPPTRGMVSFDAVTRRLPSQFSGMTYAAATDLAVMGTPKRPAFTITPEPTPIIGVVTGTLHTATLSTTRPTRRTAKEAVTEETARAMRRPGDDIPELPEPEEPVEPRPRPRPQPRPLIDSEDAKAFREAAKRHLTVVNPQKAFIMVKPVTRAVFQPSAVRTQVRALLDPTPVMQLRMKATIQLAAGEAPKAVGPLGDTPVFPQPMSEPLAALSQDWLLPGLERVPLDTVALLEPNGRFIEAFMLGLNVEMGRELLWRDFAIRDERATYFRRFWRAVNPKGEGDIAPIAEWGDRKLGANGAAESQGKQVVLLIRSGLFRRYPNAVVYAVPAVKEGNGRKPGPQASELHPLFRGSLQPDVTFFGFELDSAVATGDPGWYFVIQQQPTEPRFGFDVEIDFKGASHVPLNAPPAGHAMPAGTKWAHNSAHMARITRQQPVRVAIHAGELIEKV